LEGRREDTKQEGFGWGALEPGEAMIAWSGFAQS
jgi:hypothetical protein